MKLKKKTKGKHACKKYNEKKALNFKKLCKQTSSSVVHRL